MSSHPCKDADMRGREFQEERKRLGKTQEQAAAAVGVAARTISRWERDNHPVPEYALERLRHIQMDDHRPLTRVSSQRLLEELATRAALWDKAGITGDPLTEEGTK